MDFHISGDGDDANPGTAQRPWRSVERANGADLGPGDRLLFRGGERFAGTLRVDESDSGAAGQRVVIGSYGGGRATIEGGRGGGLVSRNCSHLRVENLNFVGCGRKEGNAARGIYLEGGADVQVSGVDISGFREAGLEVAGVRGALISHVYADENGQAGIECGGGEPGDLWSSDVRIEHCIAENNPGNPANLDNHSGNGIVVGQVRGCVIEYCEAMNNGWDMPREGNGPVGIWAWNADRVTIQFCVSHHNKSPSWDGGGFDFDGGVTNSVMQYNYSHDNQGPGYFLCQYWSAPAWKNNVVRYNISVNDGTKTNLGCGIEVISADAGMSDAEVYNNTVYSERGGAVGFGGRPVPGIRFRNNIFVCGGETIKGDPSHARFEGNCYWSIGERGFSAQGYSSLKEWAEATGQEMADGKLVGAYVDPRLAQMGAAPDAKPEELAGLEAYRLLAGSPCIGAGLEIEDAGGRDFWGNLLRPGRRPSMGAHEGPRD